MAESLSKLKLKKETVRMLGRKAGWTDRSCRGNCYSLGCYTLRRTCPGDVEEREKADG